MLSILIDTRNVAFDDESRAGEIGRILDDIKDKIALGYSGGEIHDINGSPAGNWHGNEDRD